MKRLLYVLCLMFQILLLASPSHAEWRRDFRELHKEEQSQRLYDYVLKDGGDVDLRDKTGMTPLLLAAAEGRMDIVKQLVGKGATIDARANDGRTPLMYAAEWGGLEVVKYLVEKGATIDARDNVGWTPLEGAVTWGGVEVVKYLVEKGANIEARANDGRTPLMDAAIRKKSAVVKLLLANGTRFSKQEMEDLLKYVSKEELIEAGCYWDLHDATYR